MNGISGSSFIILLPPNIINNLLETIIVEKYKSRETKNDDKIRRREWYTTSKPVTDILERYDKKKIQQELAEQSLKIKNRVFQRNCILVFFILTIIVFTCTIYKISQKRKNERLWYDKNLKIKDQEIKNLIQQSEIKSVIAMAEGQENERQRISRELHDRVGSMLSLIKLNLDTYNDGNFPFIKDILELLDKTYQEVRDISHDLHTGLLNHFGLKLALKDLKKKVEAHNSVCFNLFFHKEEVNLPKETEIVIFRILQELITNTLKHSDANNLDIQVNYAEEGILIITVEDDGKGSDLVRAPQKGLGLKNARYRLSSIGGMMEISSTPGKGTFILLSIPISIMKEKN